MTSTTQATRAEDSDWHRPVDIRADVLVVREPIGGVRRFTVGDAPAGAGLVSGTPWSKPARRKGQCNRTGVYYFMAIRRHVAYASLEENSLLLALDHEQSVAAILSQPFNLIFVRNEERLSHVPDYLVVRNDGSQEVWDVRPYDRIDGSLTRKAALTREFCRDAGFQYAVFDGMREVTRKTLEFLHAYADPRRYAPNGGDAAKLLEFYSGGGTLRTALATYRYPPCAVRVWTYYLLWTQQLKFDFSLPLSDLRTLRAAGT